MSGQRGDEAGRSIQVIEAVLHDPRVDMAAKAGQIRLFRHHDHAVGLAHSGGDRLLVERHEGAQINDLDSPTIFADDSGGGGTRL